MLTTLAIKNYAIIEELAIDLTEGFSVITGETGAGKSILMGALSLILGQRADSSVLFNTNEKCVVEGKFKISINTELKSFFEENDLDLEIPIVLRREITNSGKSRAFVNDTPVQLTILRELGLKLIDIHSQHSNLDLVKRLFQLNVVDLYSSHSVLLNNYTKHYNEWTKLLQQHKLLKEKASNAKKDIDYYEFQFKQLDEAKLVEGEQEELEQEQEKLTHSEDIKTGLNLVLHLLDTGEFNAIGQIKESLISMQKLANFLPEGKILSNRLESQLIELKDISSECEILAEKTDHNPEKLETITNRLSILYSLEQKHRVETVEELIRLRDNLSLKIETAASYDEEIIHLESQIEKSYSEVVKHASILHISREKNIKALECEISEVVYELGMPNSRFKIELANKDEYGLLGNSEVFFMFSANKGAQPDEINKVASGGELSRLMLAIKTVVAKSKALPAIIFDEIDTGISGETAMKMAIILRKMAKHMQVINITHLPQIAAKGQNHFYVYKDETPTRTTTGIKKLTPDERIVEIAKMLSGENPSIAAIENAKSLLNN